MENDILDSLEDLGYKGPLLEDSALDLAVSGGAASPEYTKLCAWLVTELKAFYSLEENVNATNGPKEAEGFQLEMSGLLTEINCPYSLLTTGDVTKRLHNKNNCLLLLTFLISELEASRMLAVNKTPEKKEEEEPSPAFVELKSVCITLGMSKPPANITMFQFFSGIEKKLKESFSKVPPNHVGKPLVKKMLGPAHWEKLEVINQMLVNEYECRRNMLLKRMDVTIQSFGWSERAKSQSEKLAKIYQPRRAALTPKGTICTAHLLAAREDLSKIMRTSSGSTREKTACSLNKVLMGRVPDRGGRPNEIEPPPPEMPPWQKRPDNPPSGGGRGGGRGGYEQGFYGGGGRGGGGYDRGSSRGGHDRTEQVGRGGGRGKIQGGWSEGSGGYQDSGYHGGGGGGGGYHGGMGGYQGGGGGGGNYQGGGYQGGGYQGHQDNRYQDGGHDQGGGGRAGGGRSGRGRGGRGGRGGQGWGSRGGVSYNQAGQFEQYFQQGGQQFSQSGFYQGRQYTS